MIFKYYGINTSLHEVLYNSGIGYSLIYINHGFIDSYQISQTPGERSFLATLYGLSYQIWYPDTSTVPDEECWQEYWTRTKQNISKDIPVTTSVDPYSLPYLRKKYNITDNETHYGHAIVLVGFNDTNATVCYNDPAAGLWNDEVNGTYVYISKETLKNVVQNTTATKYLIETFTNQSDSPPLPKNKRFEKAHERNIQKMKGKLEGYSDLRLPLFPKLGIKAVEAFKKDLRIGITRRMATVFLYGITDYQQLINVYLPIAIEKYNASQYLLENENLSSICKHDASLLQKESNCWENMTIFALDLSYILKNNGFLKSLIKSIVITQKMKKTLNEIISIERAIISG